MSLNYDPKTNSSPSWVSAEQRFDTKGCTHKNEMPPEAQEWFDRPAREGYEWKCLNGKWPEEVPIPPPSEEQQYVALITERNTLLQKFDWLIQRHTEQSALNSTTTLSAAQFEEVLRWRQALRELPQKYPTSDAWVWPSVPEIITEITRP